MNDTDTISMNMSYEDTMLAIKEQLDPEEVIDVLGLTTEELLDLPDIKMQILEKKLRFDFLDRP